MSSFDETQRQLRFAIILIAILFPISVVGFMLLESLSLADAFWLTIITLGTIGYGDLVPVTNAGRIFTVIIIIFGLGSVALAAQAAVVFFVSPNIRMIRQRRRALNKIANMHNHYVICGEGELVDRTINYLLRRAELRRLHQREAIESNLDDRLERYLGQRENGLRAILRRAIKKVVLPGIYIRYTGQTLLDVIVVVTKNEEYAHHLHDNDILVIEDDPTDDVALRRAGITHAQAVMAMLENDTENLLCVLTVRARNPQVYITAAIHDDELSLKMTRVGANNVLAPFEIAGQFLNNATLRPAVNAYFNSILFDQKASSQLVQLQLPDNSTWIGKTLGSLRLRERLETSIIGLRDESGLYVYAPEDDHVILEDTVLLAVTPGYNIAALQQDCCQGSITGSDQKNWQQLPIPHVILTNEKTYSLHESERAIEDLSRHYLICGSGPVISRALDNLNPARPFVVVSDDHSHTSEMLSRGFRVVHGSPTQDDTLKKAGVERALAIMISIEDKADALLTVLNCRTLNRNILITATAKTDDMVPKLRRAGADRVVSAYRIAAQFVLLATTRPTVSDFMQYVLFNYQAKIETTELYMQNNSPWIGKRISELELKSHYGAAVIGVRMSNNRFVYAPPADYILQEDEVIIAIAPMSAADELRTLAHGGGNRRPRTLRDT